MMLSSTKVGQRLRQMSRMRPLRSHPRRFTTRSPQLFSSAALPRLGPLLRGLPRHRPMKFGVRFSRNANGPSWASSLAHTAWKVSASPGESESSSSRAFNDFL